MNCPRCGLAYTGSTSRCSRCGYDLSSITSQDDLPQSQQSTDRPTINLESKNQIAVNGYLVQGSFITTNMSSVQVVLNNSTPYLMEQFVLPSNGLTDRYEMEFEFRKKLVHPQLPILEEFFFTQEHLNVISAYPNAKPLLNIILGDANEKGLPIHHRFPDNVAHVIEWILQLGSALNVLHSQKPFPIIHRNLNPSTLLIGDTGLHLLNFGIPSSILRAENIFDRFDAPYNFSAPEITGLENFSLQSDIFSFGRIIDFLLTGFIPSSRNENPLCLTNSIDLGKDNRIKLLTKIVEVCCQQSRIKRIATIKQALDPLWSLLSLQKQADQPMTICRCGQPNRSSSRFCVCCSRLLHNDEPRMRNNEEVIPPIPIEWQNANENQVVKNYNDKKVSKFEHYRLHSILNKVQSDPGFDSLSCLDSLPFVDKLPHQKAAALTVLKDMRGRALLADEVGLGKTIEAGIILKELFERKLIESVLILCPRQLLRQWQLELYSKFDELFLVMGRDVDSSLAWYSSRLIAPYQILEEKFHIEELLLQHYDLVILDEVHFLNDERNWRTLRTVRNLRKKYFLLLSATPMHNDLKELYNIITLLRPGHLPEWKAFSDKYIDENSATGTKNTSELKKLLHQVMIRHTRRDVAKDYPFPIRRAFRQELTLTQKDSEFYNDFRMFYQKKLRNINNRRMMYTMGEIVERLSSSPAAFREAIHNYRWQIIRSLGDRFFTDLERFSANYPQSLIQPKIDAMQEHATKYLSEGHKILVFSQFNETTRYVFNQLKRTDLGEFCFLYDESVSDVEKANVIRQFRRTNSGILLCPGEVSEGLNLQFASVMINLDLPWDPMKIEQRIGRIQRIGGSAEIFIVNLVLKGTLEEEILSILEHKIRMFEAVVGKVEEIIGNLSDAEDFRIMIGNLYLNRQVEIQEDSEDDIHQVTANVFIEHAIDSAVNRTEQGKDQLNSIFMEGLDGEEHHV